jgi:para-aminobenzoate synthetase component 1
MEFIPPNVVRQSMDDLGRKRCPFLFAVDFELTKGFIIEEPKNSEMAYFSVWGQGLTTPKNLAILEGKELISPMPECLDYYRHKFEIVQAGLARGDSFLVNLTIKTPIECHLSLEDIFWPSDSPYRLYIPGHFVCFSPERFVKIQVDGTISTCPMKGTINNEILDAENVILNDFKESAEHATVVDLLRNDLSLSATGVTVNRYRYIDRVKTSQREILQVSSDIRGSLGQDFHSRLGEVIFKMLPAGSISGAPKESTLDIIRRAEDGPRGFYTGVFGYYDGQEFDSGVLIRFIEEENGQKYFRSGGGITAYSSLVDEYNEALEKIYLPFQTKPQKRK